MRYTCTMSASRFSFHLPYHKGDRFFDGNTILIEHHPNSPISALPAFTRYLIARDSRFPLHPELWLTSEGHVPTYSWVVSRLQSTLGREVGGHSIHSGGATALALAGVPDNLIQLMGRWS